MLTIETDTRTDSTYGKPDTTLGGHQAHLSTRRGRRTAVLFDLLPNQVVLLTASARGPIDQSELARVAAGLRPVANPGDAATWVRPLPQG